MSNFKYLSPSYDSEGFLLEVYLNADGFGYDPSSAQDILSLLDRAYEQGTLEQVFAELHSLPKRPLYKRFLSLFK